MNKKVIGKILQIISVVLIALVLLLCIPVTVPQLFGYQAYDVVSGSMEPTIPVHSVVFAKSVAPTELKAEDIAVFASVNDATGESENVTHRVVENHTDDKQLITKGDANEAQDMHPRDYDSVQGIVTAHIPFMGGIYAMLTETQGKIYLVCVLVAAVLLRSAGGVMRKE